MRSKQILIVEDEPALAEVIRDYLIAEGMEVRIIQPGEDPTEIALTTKPDLIVLDLMLPVKDGLTICREVREHSQIPIIMETAKTEEIDRLLGLELGADDYLCKPFSPRELVARVKAVLRRTSGQQPSTNQSSTVSRLVLNAETWVAMVDDTPIPLTRREFNLLAVLYNRPGRVFSRQQLLELGFPDDTDVFDRTIDSHIKNIRTKIRKQFADFDPIRSVYGVGYAYEES